MPEKLSPLIDALLTSQKSGEIFASNGFSIIDFADGEILLSEGLEKLRVRAVDFWDHTLADKVFPEDRQSFLALYEKLRAGKADRAQLQLRALDENGTPHWLMLTFQVVTRDERGAVTLLAIHDHDSTDLIAAQQEIRERLVEIESLKDLLFSINKSLDLNETINRIIEHLHRIIPFDRASVQTLEGGFLTVIGSFGYAEALMQDLRFPATGIDNPSARAIASRRPIICNDVEHDFEGFVKVESGIDVKSWLGIPLVYEGKVIGLFALDSGAPKFYTNQHVRIASNVAEHIAMAIEHARQHTLVKEEARTDKLTGVANRYGLETRGQELFARASKDDQHLGILMLDIDRFKDVNDRFGHAYGDQVLIALAGGVAESLRNNDYLVRYGGEEFVILLPGTMTREALVVAERLRGKVMRLKVDAEHACPTISVGVFSGVPGSGDMLHEFIRRADLALYDAKQAGRNRCRVWNPQPEYFDKNI
ncbi:sensor domain-containing diguanylate cyclase [bacterium]|nr:sensor domain-containing diguanylate cyclase [bacterium]